MLINFDHIETWHYINPSKLPLLEGLCGIKTRDDPNTDGLTNQPLKVNCKQCLFGFNIILLAGESSKNETSNTKR